MQQASVSYPTAPEASILMSWLRSHSHAACLPLDHWGLLASNLLHDWPSGGPVLLRLGLVIG